MKSKLFGLICIVLLLAFSTTAFAGGGGQRAGRPIELNFAHHYGAGHEATALFQAFADRIVELSGGRVNVTVFPGEALVAGRNMWDALLDGVVDIGVQDTGWALTNFPTLSASYVVGTRFNNSVVSTRAVHDFFTTSDFPENRQVKMLFAYGMTPYCLISRAPLRTLEDLRGVQIRATGSLLPAITALGGTPVGITIAETYDALLRGVADAVIVPLEALEGWNFGEIVKYVTFAPIFGAGHHYIGMNMDTWNSLPRDIQGYIEQASREAMESFTTLFDRLDESAYEFGRRQGVTFYTLPDQELNRWITALRPLELQWVNETAARGFPAREALDKIRSLADRYNAQYGN